MARTEKQQAYRRGIWAERYACLYLRLKGYRLLAARAKTPVGEVDLIFQKSGMVVAVEVKNRPDPDQAAYSLGPAQQQRIGRALQYWLQSRQALQSLGVRFDAVLVSGGRITHLQDVWRL